MSLFVPVALLLAAASSDSQDVELTADRLVSDPATHVLTGHAQMRTDDSVVSADEIVFDRATQVATARGHVTMALASDGLYGAVADVLVVRLDQRRVKDVFADHGYVMQKMGITQAQLFAARSPAEMDAVGHTSLTLRGTHLEHLGTDRWAVDGLELDPCDCPADERALRVSAPHARVRLDDRRVSLDFPAVFVKSVPVFWLPWVDLPLSTRASGLLPPRPTYGKNGFGLELPVFLTLGRSYDTTLTPAYFSGQKGLDGVTGPRLQAEFRYAPAEATSGRATLGLLYDTRNPRDPRFASVNVDPAAARGLRADASVLHVQDLGGGWYDRVDASLLSDGYYRSDLTAEILAREDKYLRSSATVFHRSDQLFAGLEVGLVQDLRWGYRLFGRDVSKDGAVLPGPSPLQKLPALVVDAPERPLAGPVHGSFRAEFARYSPLLSRTGDEGISANEGRARLDVPGEGFVELPAACQSERLFWPDPLPDEVRAAVCPAGVTAPDKAGQGDGVFQPGEREARDRLDLRPRLSASLAAGRAARFTPYAAFREDVYLGEVTGRTSHRGYPVAGLIADSELSRVFGGADRALWHSIASSVELRYVPFVLGEEPAPYDDIDTAVPGQGRLFQAVAEVRQRLLRRSGATTSELARLDLGQGFDLLAMDVRESYTRAVFALAPVRLVGVARSDFPNRRVTQVSAGLFVDSPAGDSVFAGYDRLFVPGSDRTRQGDDVLFGVPPPQFGADFAEQLVGGFRGKLGLGLAVDYSATLVRTAPTTGLAPVLTLSEQRLGLSYGPPCNCWRVEGHAVHVPSRGNYLVLPTLGASLSISGFGTLGTGT